MSAPSSSTPKGGSSSAPPPKPVESRNATVEEDDDDDLDDLDDVLDSLNAPKPAARAGAPAAPAVPVAGPSAPAGAGGDDDFEAELMQGMESLLRSLANEGPAGAAPDAKAAPGAAGKDAATGLGADEQEAFQRYLEMMMAGEGLDGLDKPGPSGARGAQPKEALNFEETIKRAMDSVNTGGAGAAGARDEMPGDLAALLKQLSEDPSALDGLGDDDDELGGLLDGMMAQLMSKEVLEEPMTELAAKYPIYLESPPAGVTPADVEKYRKQHELVKQILDVFKRPGYTDDKDGKEVAKLVGEMQDLGGPPNEIMGDLPEGFDLGALGGGEEGCVVM